MQESVKTKRRMVRKQFFITAEQNRRLKAEAARLGVPEAELIRVGIDMRLERKRDPDDWRNALDRLSGAWRDRDDMNDFIRDLRRQSTRSLRRRLGLDERKKNG
jgi:hypothetical protein